MDPTKNSQVWLLERQMDPQDNISDNLLYDVILLWVFDLQQTPSHQSFLGIKMREHLLK